MTALGWLYWIVWQALAVVLMVVGWFLLLPLALCGAWHDRPGLSKHYPGRTVKAWRGGWLTLPWDNEEDGVTGAAWYSAKHPTWPLWMRAYLWSAWRNSANNLRFLPGAFVVLDATKIVVRASASLTSVTHGWRQYVLIHPAWLPFVLRAGWLVRPEAATGDYAWPVVGKL